MHKNIGNAFEGVVVSKVFVADVSFIIDFESFDTSNNFSRDIVSEYIRNNNHGWIGINER